MQKSKQNGTSVTLGFELYEFDVALGFSCRPMSSFCGNFLLYLFRWLRWWTFVQDWPRNTGSVWQNRFSALERFPLHRWACHRTQTCQMHGIKIRWAVFCHCTFLVVTKTCAVPVHRCIFVSWLTDLNVQRVCRWWSSEDYKATDRTWSESKLTRTVSAHAAISCCLCWSPWIWLVGVLLCPA